MDRFKQLGRTIRKDIIDTQHNTRRIQANMPMIERKLDALAGDDTFHMQFPLTPHKHTVHLNLRIKPDNCCDCEPGAATVKRDAIAYMYPGFPEVGWDTTNFGNVPTGEMQQAIYVEPLAQTGTTFNYGWHSISYAFLYQTYPVFGGYEINPSGGVIVPVDGMYAVMFRNTITIYPGGSDTYLVTAILQNGESISQKVYSVAKGTLPLGASSKVYYQYASCIPLHAGDIVGAGLKSNASFWQLGAGGLSRDTGNSTRFVLLGLGFGFLTGKVFDQVTGLPISGATVSYTIGFGGSTTTDANGYYEFDELTPGPYSITVTKSGYITQTRDVQVVFDDIAILDFAMKV